MAKIRAFQRQFYRLNRFIEHGAALWGAASDHIVRADSGRRGVITVAFFQTLINQHL